MFNNNRLVGTRGHFRISHTPCVSHKQAGGREAGNQKEHTHGCECENEESQKYKYMKYICFSLILSFARFSHFRTSQVVNHDIFGVNMMRSAGGEMFYLW
jgi:hypothetical protein